MGKAARAALRAFALCLLALLAVQPALSKTSETVDIEPAYTQSDGGSDPQPEAAADPDTARPRVMAQLVVPELPQAEIEPLDITPEWDINGFDVTQYRVPTETAALVGYLTEGYTPAHETLSLPAAVALALRYNHELNQRRLEAMAACAGIDINWAELRPQVAVNTKSFIGGTIGDSNGIGTSALDRLAAQVGTGRTNDGQLTHQLALNVTQRIYDWGLTHDLIERDEAQYAVRVHVVEASEQQIVSNVIAAYFEFSLALGQLRIRIDAVALAQEFLRQTQIQFDVGTVPRLDVIRAEARLEEARQDVTTAQEQLGNAAARFFALLGVEYTRYVPEIVTADLLEIGPPPPPLDDAVSAGIGLRPEVDMQFATLLAGEAAVELARRRPVLEGYASGLTQTPKAAFGSASYELGMQLLWNAYNGGREQAERRQASINVEAIREGIHQLESNIELDVTTAWNRLIAARSGVDAARRNLDLSAEALRAAAVGYSAGVTPFIEFQDALDRNIAAALTYLFALGDVKISEANLQRAMGFPGGFPGGLTAEMCRVIGEDAVAELRGVERPAQADGDAVRELEVPLPSP